MSRTVRGSKGCGYDYWGKRALSQCKPGRATKKLTLGMERVAQRQLIHDEVNDLSEEHSYVGEDYSACEATL